MLSSHNSSYRSVGYGPRTVHKTKVAQRNQKGFAGLALMLAVSAFLIWASLMVASSKPASAAALIPEIRSGQPGYCLGIASKKATPNAVVTTDLCNGSLVQEFSISGSHIMTDNKLCLSAINSSLLLEACSPNANNQNWSANGVGLENASNNQCLSLTNNKVGASLITASCNNLNSLSETWTPTEWQGKAISDISDSTCTQAQTGKRVACMANRQWLAWQNEPKLHAALLYDYTDGNPSEEWCADLVSYIYKEANASFSNGERGLNGWDEYNANDIVSQGFSYHAAASGYLPQPGDVAYFNYQGGHAEIVVVGGNHPVFIYGDSGTIDPASGNGDMAENQMTSDGSAGQLEYYLSPNF